MRPRSLIAAAILSFALAVPVAQEADDSADSPDLPLEPARTLSLDTDEGTWISVDVSPDGETIVFDLLGDLYTMPFAGGDATPLTEGMAYDSQPRYSPDGSRVVFVSDRDGSENLWLIDVASQATRQVTNAPANNYESPEWLPDGDYVVAAVGAGASGRGRLRAQPEAVDVARQGGHRNSARKGAGLAPDHRTGPDARRTAHLVRAAGAPVAVQRDLSAIPARGVRPGDG